MRYQTARVVLGACLIAATAAAQAPASSGSSGTGSSGTGVGGTPIGAAEFGNFQPGAFEAAMAADSLGGASLGGARGSALRPTRSVQQDPDGYPMSKLFADDYGDFMQLRERYNPQIELSGRVMPNMRIQDEPGSFDHFGYGFDMQLPFLLSPESYLSVGAYYNGRRYLTSSAFGTKNNGAGNGIGDETLIATGVHVGFGVFLGKNVLFEMQTSPGIYSDIDDTLHHNDLDFPSSAMFTIRPLDRFFFKIGARYNQVYEDAPWLPLLGFSWEVVEGFRIDVLAPQTAEMSFWPTTSTGILFGGEVTGAEYHVHTAEALNQRANARVQEAIIYLGLVQRMSDSFSLQARCGAVVAGHYELTTGAAGFDPAEGTLDQALFADVTFGINF